MERTGLYFSFLYREQHMRAMLIVCGLLAAFTAPATGPVVVSPSAQIRLWDREVRDIAEALLLETRQLEARQVIDLLERASADPALDPVARDAALYQYVQRLRRLPAEDMPQAVLDWLAQQPPQAVRLHDESPSFRVPVFDVATAARGVANERRYRLSRKSLLSAEKAELPALISEYAAWTDRPARAGMEAAVEDLPPEFLTPLAGLLDHEPAVRHSRLRAAVLLRQQSAGELAELLEQAPAALATYIVRQSAARLDVDGADIVTRRALAHPDPGTRGVARAQATRGETDRPSGQGAELVDWTEGPGALGLGYPVPVPQDTPLPFDGFRTYAGLHERHQDLMQSSENVSGEIVGHTRLDRDIWLYHFGDPETPNAEGLPRAAFLVNGTIHAREWQSPETVTGFLEFLAENEDDGHWISYLRDNMNIMLIPVNNVDGFLQTQRYPRSNYLGSDPEFPDQSPRDGRMRRKNHFQADEELGTAGDHLNGVDLNRNNEPIWPGESRNFNPGGLTYHGPDPHSEPEIRALQAAATLGPEDRLRFFADMHSYTRVFFSVNTHNTRRNRIQSRLLTMIQRHHRALPGNKLYLDSPSPPDTGLGTTSEYFAYTYQIPSLTWEIEPGRGAGTEYGGFGANSHDGFILPESEIRRVRENLAESLAAAAYHMAGPPHLQTLHVVDEATGALVFESGWTVTGARSRRLDSRRVRPLEPGRRYLFWLAFNKPMRWREDGQVAAFPGQSVQGLNLHLGLRAGGAELETEQSAPAWAEIQAPSPAGFYRYRDDAAAIRVEIIDSPANRELIRQHDVVANVDVRDMTGQRLDDDPSTVADWHDGAWTGYAGDVGGVDGTRVLPAEADTRATPFPIDPGHSALWYERERSGEGFVLENLDGERAVMYWFTYDEDGAQRWLTGIGEIHGNRISFPELLVTAGGRFGPGFDPDEVVRKVVGSGEFLFTGCNHGWFDFEGFGQAGRFELSRLSHTMAVTCDPPDDALELTEAAYSGTWYDPGHSGEGFIVQWMANGALILVWFTYDSDGNQYWMIGNGERDGEELVFPDLHATRGARFGAGFEPDDVERFPWGDIRLRLACEQGEAHYDSLLPEFGSGHFQLIPLTRLAGLACAD